MTTILRQRKNWFRTTCKSKGKCCKVIIDSGSTDNIVSTKMGINKELIRTTVKENKEGKIQMEELIDFK